MNERISEMVGVKLYILWTVKMSPLDTSPHAVYRPIKSINGRCTGGQNHMSSTGVRSHLFCMSFRVIDVIGLSTVGQMYGPEQLSPSLCSYS